jgi:hypothetical protein
MRSTAESDETLSSLPDASLTSILAACACPMPLGEATASLTHSESSVISYFCTLASLSLTCIFNHCLAIDVDLVARFFSQYRSALRDSRRGKFIALLYDPCPSAYAMAIPIVYVKDTWPFDDQATLTSLCCSILHKRAGTG